MTAPAMPLEEALKHLAQVLSQGGTLNSAAFDVVSEAALAPRSGLPSRAADELLTQFREHPAAWALCAQLLQESKSPLTRQLALQKLGRAINLSWRALDPQQQQGIRNFVLQNCMERAQAAQTDSAVARELRTGWNLALIYIVKHTWPAQWPDFIPELVRSSQHSAAVCCNNLQLLQQMSEELFENKNEGGTLGSVNLTASRRKALKMQLNKEFAPLFQLLLSLLQQHDPNDPQGQQRGTPDARIVRTTLRTLEKFLAWIPVEYIYATPLLELLCAKYFVPAYLREVWPCLVEVASLDAAEALRGADMAKQRDFENKSAQMFAHIVGAARQGILDPTQVSAEALARRVEQGDAGLSEQCHYLAVFLTSFFKQKRLLLALEGREDMQAALHTALQQLLRIAAIDDRRMFRICLDFWTDFVCDLQSSRGGGGNTPRSRLLAMQRGGLGFSGIGGLGGLGMGGLGGLAAQANAVPRHERYAAELSEMRRVLITRMTRPKEVIITTDENGNVVKEYMTDSDALQLHAQMRRTLRALTQLSPEDTVRQMNERIRRQADFSEYSWDRLNSLCWAIGAISGTMREKNESTFLVDVIQVLLDMVAKQNNKKDKAVIASNIMYVVGQYPRFLKAHWKFLKTVLKKLLDFMHERFEGVQEMACETFLRIADTCGKALVTLQPRDPEQAQHQQPFLLHHVIGRDSAALDDHVRDLSPEHRRIFYEACGAAIRAAVVNGRRQEAAQMIEQLMLLPNRGWQQIVMRANENVATLFDANTATMLAHLLDVNEAVCRRVQGSAFLMQLSTIYLDMLKMYRAYSQFVADEIARKGAMATQHLLAKRMRTVKSRTLRLLATFVRTVDDRDVPLVAEKFLPQLMGPVLGDYEQAAAPEAREAQVLALFSDCVSRDLHRHVPDLVPRVMSVLFGSTLQMITADFEAFPDVRIQFYRLLRAVCQRSADVFFRISPDEFSTVIHSIVYAFRHLQRDVAETGLEILVDLLARVEKSSGANEFFRRYYDRLLTETFSVLTDTLHTSGFSLQCKILARLFAVVEQGSVTAPLWNEAEYQQKGQAPPPNNHAFVRHKVTTMLRNAFGNLSPELASQFVASMFSASGDTAMFERTMQDFLVSIRENVALPPGMQQQQSSPAPRP
ncbi:MAG: hypothetical protein MHM6MM_005967 [Cercozoa sp. M6MM]